eukprot:XP_027299043.1 zinc finger and BTB domain-containing protein 40 [Anas platyrhynchos]
MHLGFPHLEESQGQPTRSAGDEPFPGKATCLITVSLWPAAESKSCKLDFFLRYESVFSEALSDAYAVLRRLEECREIDASQREALVACLAEAGEQLVFTKLLGKVKDAQPLDAQTLVSLLKLFQDVNPNLRAALLEKEQDSGEALQQTESTKEGEMLTARLLGCREELIQSVTQLSPLIEFLEAAEEGFLTALEKQFWIAVKAARRGKPSTICSRRWKKRKP